jgi:hypothetical protein
MIIKLKLPPKYGQERTVKKFAWFPMFLTVKDPDERIFIWLSSYTESQMYYKSTGWNTTKITL